MAHSLPLNEMSIEEKLQMMEALWDDLSRNAPSSRYHNGTATYSPSAKRRRTEATINFPTGPRLAKGSKRKFGEIAPNHRTRNNVSKPRKGSRHAVPSAQQH